MSCFSFGHYELSGLCNNLGEDIHRYLTKSPENFARGNGFKARLNAFLTPELLCLLLYRLSHYSYVIGHRRVAEFFSRLNFVLHKVSITPQSCIGPGCRLAHPTGVVFHGRAGRDLTLYAMAVCCPREEDFNGPVEKGPLLGDRVTVGGQAVLLGPIVIGDDDKIAYNVKLERDAPPGVLVFSRSLKVSVTIDAR